MARDGSKEIINIWKSVPDTVPDSVLSTGTKREKLFQHSWE